MDFIPFPDKCRSFSHFCYIPDSCATIFFDGPKTKTKTNSNTVALAQFCLECSISDFLLIKPLKHAVFFYLFFISADNTLPFNNLGEASLLL